MPEQMKRNGDTYEVTSSEGKGSIREDGENLVITIQKPQGKSLEEITNIAGHSCHDRCQGLVTNAIAFVA